MINLFNKKDDLVSQSALLLFCSTLFLILFSSNLRAQTNQTLKLKEAIELSTSKSNMLKEYEEKLKSFEYSKLIANDFKLPQVSIQGSYYRLSDNIEPFTVSLPNGQGNVTFNPQILNQYNTKLNITEVLFDGLKVRENIKASQHRENAASLDLEKQKIEVAWQTIQIYSSLQKHNLTLQVLVNERDNAISNLNLTKQFAKFGTVNRNEVLSAELQVSNLDLSILQIENQIKNDQLLLALNIGIEKDKLPALDNKISKDDYILQSLDSYLEQAQKNRLELKSLSENIEASYSNVKIVNKSKLPKVSFSSNLYYANPNSRLFPTQDTWKGTWDVGINLTYNITNLYTSNHTFKYAKSEWQALKYKKLDLADDITKEVEKAYYNCTYSNEKIKVTRVALTQAEENYQVVSAKYKNGSSLLNDLLIAQTLRITSKLNAETSIIDNAIAYYNFFKSIGNLNLLWKQN